MHSNFISNVDVKFGIRVLQLPVHKMIIPQWFRVLYSKFDKDTIGPYFACFLEAERNLSVHYD